MLSPYLSHRISFLRHSTPNKLSNPHASTSRAPTQHCREYMRKIYYIVRSPSIHHASNLAVTCRIRQYTRRYIRRCYWVVRCDMLPYDVRYCELRRGEVRCAGSTSYRLLAADSGMRVCADLEALRLWGFCAAGLGWRERL